MQLRQLIIGQKYKQILKSSICISNNVYWIPDNPFVDIRLNGHADLSVFNYKGTIYAHDYLKAYLNIRNCIFIDEIMDKKYPYDVKFNACAVGDYVFLNERYVSQKILEDLSSKGSTLIDVNQGYCNCSILELNENSLITSDNGIYNAAKSNNLNVLKIDEGFIELPGYSYGFIGGAGFMLDDYRLAFTGNLDIHPNKNIIIDFCKNLNIDIVYLTDSQIFDIGGAIKAE